jgi:predicted 3-demethylubiquinone-9 3-methyltransferase (glyoxalase superfamily)
MSGIAKPGITPFLWFDGDVEEAASATVTLRGQQLHLLNGGPHYQLNPAVSLMVDCETQAEVDDLWEKLSAGGAKSRCGWLQDRFGLSWQIVPTILPKLLRDPNPAKANAALQAMLQMDKLDIPRLQQASDQA